MRFTSKNELEELAESEKIGASEKSITGIRIIDPRINRIGHKNMQNIIVD